MSWQATEWVRVTRVGDSKLKLLLLMLCNYANEDGESWYSQEQIASDTEIPVRTLRRKLDELQEMGFIEVVHRVTAGGLKKNSLIRVLMGPAASLAGGESHRPNSSVSIGQNEGDPSANKVAAVNLNHNNHRNHKRAGVNDKIEYSEEFEAKVWQPYPRREGSKKKSYDYWNMLNDENRARVVAAIPMFAAQMKREGRPPDKIPHLTTWFNDRRYETITVAPAAPATVAPAAPWHETATREQWERVIKIYGSMMDWRPALGPEPGKPGCGVPEDLIETLPYGLRPNSKQSVDKSPRPVAPSSGEPHGLGSTESQGRVTLA